MQDIGQTNMEVSQVILNGERFLQNGRPVILGISIGNPHYYKQETLVRLFDFAARNNSDQVSYFLPDRSKIYDTRMPGEVRGETTRIQLEERRLIFNHGTPTP